MQREAPLHQPPSWPAPTRWHLLAAVWSMVGLLGCAAPTGSEERDGVEATPPGEWVELDPRLERTLDRDTAEQVRRELGELDTVLATTAAPRDRVRARAEVYDALRSEVGGFGVTALAGLRAQILSPVEARRDVELGLEEAIAAGARFTPTESDLAAANEMKVTVASGGTR